MFYAAIFCTSCFVMFYSAGFCTSYSVIVHAPVFCTSYSVMVSSAVLSVLVQSTSLNWYMVFTIYKLFMMIVLATGAVECKQSSRLLPRTPARHGQTSTQDGVSGNCPVSPLMPNVVVLSFTSTD